MWSWAAILKFAITTGVATAVLNNALTWVKDEVQRREKDRRAGKVLALSLVQILTNYAQRCHERFRLNRFGEQDGGYGTHEIDDLPPYQEPDPGWEALPSDIAAAVRDFRNEVYNAKQRVAETNQLLGPPEAIHDATYRYVNLGFKAWQLSERLRKHYGFGRYSGDLIFINEMKVSNRKANMGPVRQLWHSLPMSRLRYKLRAESRRVWQWLHRGP